MGYHLIVFALIKADESPIQTPTSSGFIQQAFQIIGLARLELEVVLKVPCSQAAPIRAAKACQATASQTG